MNRAVITEQITQAIRSCEDALRLQEDPFIAKNAERLAGNLRAIDGAHCKSWLGYHAYIYYRDFGSPAPGDHFSPEWGFEAAFSNPTSRNWVECAPEAVEMATMRGVAPEFRERLAYISKRAEDTFAEAHDTVLTSSDVLLDLERTSTLQRLRDEISKLEGRIPVAKVIKAMNPGPTMSRDSTAAAQGFRCPPHSAISAELVSLRQPFAALSSLIKSSRSLLKYMEIHDLADHAAMQKAERVRRVLERERLI